MLTKSKPSTAPPKVPRHATPAKPLGDELRRLDHESPGASVKLKLDEDGSPMLPRTGSKGSVVQAPGAGKKRGREEGPGFDPETGALSRDYETFQTRTEKRRRGFGATPEKDDHPLLRPHLGMIVGPTGAGKSTLAFNLMDEISKHIDPKKLGDVIYYSGSPGDPLLKKLDPDRVAVYGPKEADRFMAHLSDLNIRDPRTGEFLNERRPGQPLPEDKRKLHVVMMDDATANPDLTPANAKGHEMGHIALGHRHHSMVMYTMAQRMKMVPVIIRDNYTHMFAFPGSQKENKELLPHMAVQDTKEVEKALRNMSRRREKGEFLWSNRASKSVMQGFGDTIAH